MLRHLAFPAVLVAALLAASPAGGQPSDDLPECTYADTPGTVWRTPLPRGFTVELRRAGDDGEACTLRLVDAGGATALERTGFGARVVPPSGQDLDGDGTTDAVLSVDGGGGNRCCWNTIVVTLASPARVRLDVAAPLGWLADPPRGFVAEQVVPFYELGPDMATAPVAIRLYRLGASGLAEVTRDFCDRLLAPDATGVFSRDDEWRWLTATRRSASRAGAGEAFDLEQTRLAATAMTLQFHVCGRAREADALVGSVWPSNDAPAVRRRLAAAAAAAARAPK